MAKPSISIWTMDTQHEATDTWDMVSSFRKALTDNVQEKRNYLLITWHVLFSNIGTL